MHRQIVRYAEEDMTGHCVISIVLRQRLSVGAAAAWTAASMLNCTHTRTHARMHAHTLHTHTHTQRQTVTDTHTGRQSQTEQIKMTGHYFLHCIAGLLLLLLL